MGSLDQTESFETASISLVRSQTNRDGANSRRVRNHEKKKKRRCCSPIGHNISIRLAVWKWSGESFVFETFRRAFSPNPADCPWVSEDEFP